jgi:hypothetical protein
MKIINIVTTLILAAITIYLLYRLFTRDEFNRNDHILMIVICSAGAVKLSRELYMSRKTK